jgi:hypothetical protein
MTAIATQYSVEPSSTQRANLAALTGMGLVLISTLAVTPTPTTYSGLAQLQTSSSQSFIQLYTQVDSQSLVQALSALHDRLLFSSSEMDPEAKDILYADLWNLYSV